MGLMISVVQLGTVSYEMGLKLQRTLIDLRHAGRVPNTLLLLEHNHVITLGRNAKRENILAAPALLEREGVEVFECDRGGDVTYHGPGQLVGYPIFDLRSFSILPSGDSGGMGPQKTMGAVDYVRRLEEVLIRTCTDFGLAAERLPKLTGVWTRPAAPGTAAAKVAAIGVHISRGITSHGFALNVNTNLEHFQLIVPCGIATKPVTSLSKEKGAEVSLDGVAESVARNFGRVFNSQILWVDTLDALLGRSVGVPNREPKELRQMHETDIFSA
jgi:lipoyl(octanoyl) transferase